MHAFLFIDSKDFLFIDSKDFLIKFVFGVNGDFSDLDGIVIVKSIDVVHNSALIGFNCCNDQQVL